jgi:ribosomal protein S18 acetylase RimI-like enzyme
MFKILFQVCFLLTSSNFAEAISEENRWAFETPITWSIVYPPWHQTAVESHKTFCARIHANDGEEYVQDAEDMKLTTATTWVSSLERLPKQLDGHALTSDVMTTMMMDLEYQRIDQEIPKDLDIRLAISPLEKEDWISVGAAAIGASESGMHQMFKDVFLDASNQFEFLVGYKNKQPVVSAVVLYQGAYASIYWVCTIPEQRRKGLGTLMMINALERIRRRNMRHVVLQAQPMGEKIYSGLGFIPIGYIARY